MSTIPFKRPSRAGAPRQPGGEVHLEGPPEVPRSVPGNILMKMLPVVMIVAVVGMIALLLTSGGGGRMMQNPLFLMFPIMMLASMGGMMGQNRGGGAKKGEMNEDRKDYLRYLGQMRDKATAATDQQRQALEWSNPQPSSLWTLAGTRRMWERRPGDADFCHVRVGRGPQRLATRLVPPQTGPVDELEPLATMALRRFVRAHSIVPELPIAISLRGFAAVAMHGDREQTRGLLRAIIGQLAALHTPEDLLIAVASGGRAKQSWEWMKWLPHTQHPTETDALGPVRLMAPSLAEIEGMLDEDFSMRARFSRNSAPPTDAPHVIVVIDEAEVTFEEKLVLEEGLAGVTMIDLSESLGQMIARRGLRLQVEPERVGARGGPAGSGVEWFGRPDSLSLTESELLARKLAPYRVAHGEVSGEEEPLAAGAGLMELLGLGDPASFDVGQAWRPRPVRDKLRVPFGVGEQGQPVELDIKEAAQEGMGPHGLCVGATGSGKSEFLRTLVLGMLATHSSAALNFILVDFKGGATFLGLGDAPHVAAVITNLQDDLTLVDRMHDAISGEMNRRQELLRSAGNFANVKEYEKARENGADLDPLPALFIVVDEFSELLAVKPEFIDLFVAIGRLGRSLQMHLMLASQRLEEGKLRGLDSHLSYRIGLKTFSAAESRAVLGVPDAYELPSIPGSGYLKFDTTTMLRFKASYVSGPYRPGGIQAPVAGATVGGDRRVRQFVPEYVEKPPEPELPEVAEPEPEPEPDSNEPSMLNIVVGRLVGQGPPAHEVWLPPLEEPPSLDQMLPPLHPTEDRGLSPVGYSGNGRLNVPVAIVDKPFEQRRDLLWTDLSGASGHVAVVGGPQSGKSMMLRTLMVSLALTHTPEEFQFFGLDFGGGTLGPLSGLPHCGGVSGRLDPDKVRRTVAEVAAIVADRERRFRDMGIDSMNTFRARKRRGELSEDPFGDVFLIVDGWMNFRSEFEAAEGQVTTIATQGLSYGVHVLVGATRWAEIRPSLKDLLGTRLELRLGDAGESDVERRAATNVPANRPGRGVTKDKLHFLTALPRIDASADAEDVGEGIADAVAQIARAWTGRRAPQVRLLPEELGHDQLPTPDQQAERGLRRTLVPIGVNEAALAPLFVDFEGESHFLAFADGEHGKTNLLRVILRGITQRYTREQARIILVDYRRGMLGFLPQDGHLLGYVVSAQSLESMVEDLRISLSERMPGPDITQEQLKNRSWWTGPEVFMVVDDYDLVSTQSGNPLQPVVEYLAQAKDVGFHLIVARRSGGAGRAMFDPVISRLRELASPGIIMSGSKDEGALLGSVKPSEMPPGRGTLVSRKMGQQLTQVAWLPPE